MRRSPSASGGGALRECAMRKTRITRGAHCRHDGDVHAAIIILSDLFD